MSGNRCKPVLISACLAGISCRYDGKSNRIDEIENLKEKMRLIPVCPEQMGGLATPRCPAEIRAGSVVTKNGADVTVQFERGAEETLKMAQLFGCECAVLKARSPSCGSGEIYDGTFSKTRIRGDGKTAELLKQNGICVYTEHEIDRLVGELEGESEAAEESQKRE